MLQRPRFLNKSWNKKHPSGSPTAWYALGTPTPAGCWWVLLWAPPRRVRHHGAPVWPSGAANSGQQRAGAGPGPALLAGATPDAGARVLARCSVPSSSHNSPFPPIVRPMTKPAQAMDVATRLNRANPNNSRKHSLLCRRPVQISPQRRPTLPSPTVTS